MSYYRQPLGAPQRDAPGAPPAPAPAPPASTPGIVAVTEPIVSAPPLATTAVGGARYVVRRGRCFDTQAAAYVDPTLCVPETGNGNGGATIGGFPVRYLVYGGLGLAAVLFLRRR